MWALGYGIGNRGLIKYLSTLSGNVTVRWEKYLCVTSLYSPLWVLYRWLLQGSQRVEYRPTLPALWSVVRPFSLMKPSFAKFSKLNYFDKTRDACKCMKLMIVRDTARAALSPNCCLIGNTSDLINRRPWFNPNQSLGWWSISLTDMRNLLNLNCEKFN